MDLELYSMDVPKSTLLSIRICCLVFTFFLGYLSEGRTQALDPETSALPRQKVELKTTKGTIILELYNETPLHRDNFVKLVKKGAYDGLLFHRVIADFVIQAGDPESKNANANTDLGEGDIGYTINAEFRPDIFHKRGTVGAARDGNPERASSGIQFYIVQRGKQNDSLLEVAENRINTMLARHYAYKDPEFKDIVMALEKAQKNQNPKQVRRWNAELDTVAKTYSNFERYTIPSSHQQVYKSRGGIPHLDQNYTIFGEVVQGMDVVDAIAAVKTYKRDRPVTDVRILSARVLK